MKKILFILLSMFLFTNIVYASDYVDLLTKNITKTQVQNWDHDRTQTAILKKELDSVMGCTLTTTGSYGTDTVNCVKAFQRSYGLSVTGYINKATRELLNDIYQMQSMLVIKNGVKIRSSASFSSSSLGTYNKGKIIKVISRKKVNNHYWAKFYYNGKYGYIYEEDNLSGTFIELEIVSQTMRFYKNRVLYVDTPVVTGRADGTNNTLKGFFLAYDKAPNPTSYAQYGIKIGATSGQYIHDYVKKRGAYANYTTYGGTIYKNLSVPSGDPATGSLGCVNTPLYRIIPIYNNTKTYNVHPSNATQIIVH